MYLSESKVWTIRKVSDVHEDGTMWYSKEEFHKCVDVKVHLPMFKSRIFTKINTVKTIAVCGPKTNANAVI